MGLSTFLLGLFVFLQSGDKLGWFSADGKLLGYVGLAFVLVLVLEYFSDREGKPLTLRFWNRKPAPQNEG
jgi:hypothetical protein